MCSIPQADVTCPLILDISAEGFRKFYFRSASPDGLRLNFRLRFILNH